MEEETQVLSRTASALLHTPRVLVVDDEDMILDIISDILKDDYIVDTADGGSAALEKLIDYRYSVILLDINMPDMSGQEILKYCKQNLPFTEIIMISGFSELETAVNVIKDGAYDFIQKPFEPETMLQKVEEAVEKNNTNIAFASCSCFEIGSAEKGAFFHGYRIESPLGSGSMGVVLLAEKEETQYAIKILRRETEDISNDTSIKRFLREIEILSTIKHPNIVHIYEFGFTELKHTPYIVMEYVDGCSLIDLIKEKKLSLEQKLMIFEQLVAGLNAVHQHNIIHRDIKPSNILVTEQLEVKLTDFGVARTQDSNLTLINEILGSPVYMAPESFESKDKLDIRSDVFSLGVLCYELLTSKKPFNGNSLGEIINTIQKKKPVEPSKLIPELSPEMQDVLAKMLHKDPTNRYQSCQDILTDLEALKAGGHNQGKKSFTRKLMKNILNKSSNVWS